MKNVLKYTGFAFLGASVVLSIALLVKLIKAIGFLTWLVYMVLSWGFIFIGNMFLTEAAKSTT